MRARLALLLNNATVQLREVVLKDKPPSLRQYSPKETVPVLVMSEQFVIDESLEIIDWAVQQSSQPAFDLMCNEQQALVAQNDGAFKAILDKYKYFDRYPEQPQQFYREQGEEFLYQLELRLIHQPYLFGDEVSYADIAIFPFIRQFINVDMPWFEVADYPNLKLWLTRLLDSDAFTHAMTKFPQWHQDDDITLFPAQ